MMITLNRVGKDGSSITGSYNGIVFGVSYSQEKWDAMSALADEANKAATMEDLQAIFEKFKPLTEESYKELVETATPYLLVNKHTNKFYLRWNSITSSIAIPQGLVDRILDSIDKKVDFTPLIKCWVRFMRNVNFTEKKAQKFVKYINKTYVNYEYVAKLENEQGVTHDVAVERATQLQVAITQEGLLCTYKVSKEIDWKYEIDGVTKRAVKMPRYAPTVDEISGTLTYTLPDKVEDRLFLPVCMGEGGDTFFCSADITDKDAKAGHVIKVGAWHWLAEWDQVDCDDNRSGVKGCHVGNIDYIKGFQQAGTVTHYTFVDPADIGAITDDGTGALRVRKYFTYQSFAGVNRGIYHSSTIAHIGDLEFDAMVKKAAEDTKEAQIGLAIKNDEFKALSL